MTEALQVYKCLVCGIVAETLDSGAGELICCGQPMELMEAKTADATTEKHVPVIEAIDGGIRVTVGSVPHPMEDQHFIQWIEVLAGDKAYRQFLHPAQEPTAEFPLPAEGVTAREFCNKHGLWKA